MSWIIGRLGHLGIDSDGHLGIDADRDVGGPTTE
jgi:hypothetical protein